MFRQKLRRGQEDERHFTRPSPHQTSYKTPLIYQSRETGLDGLWLMDLNGSRKLLTEGTPGNFLPSVTADGRHLIFMSRRTGVLHVWRMDLESGALTQLFARYICAIRADTNGRKILVRLTIREI